MQISEAKLRSIIKNKILQEGFFSNNKDIEPGQSLSYGGSNASVTTLSKPVYDSLSKDYFVLVKWDSKDTPKKRFKNLKKNAWNTDLFALFHGGRYDDNHKDKLMKSMWLSKSFAKPIMKKQVGKLKKAWDEGRVAAVSTDFLQSSKEFDKQAGSNAFNEFVTDTSLEAVSAIADLGAKWIPALEGVSMAAGFSSALVKMGREDILGSAIALVTTIPVVGDTIGIMARNFKGLGSSTSVIARESAEHLASFIGKVVDGELTNAFEKCIQAFSDFASGGKKGLKEYSFETFFPKIKNALTLFLTTLHKIANGDKWNAEKELAGLKQKANAGAKS